MPLLLSAGKPRGGGFDRRSPLRCPGCIALGRSGKNLWRGGFRPSRLEGRRRGVFDAELDRLRDFRSGNFGSPHPLGATAS